MNVKTTYMPTLHIFTIHTPALKQRAIQVHGHIQTLRLKAIQAGYNVKPYLITKPSVATIESKVEEYQKMVSYDPTGMQEFDSQREILGAEAISNFMKHREVWEKIQIVANHDDICLVIEDDLFILSDGAQVFGDILELQSKEPEWHMIFPGITDGASLGSVLQYKDIRTLPMKVLPSKESYFIRPVAAKTLLDLTTTVKYKLRVQLGYIFHTQPAIKAFFCTKRCFLDGSKVGTNTSSVHGNNLLIYNKEYMELLSYATNPQTDVIIKDFLKIQQTYKTVERIRNPDIMHIYGVILYKLGKIKEAEQQLLTAVTEMQLQQGVVNARSDIMNNLIQIYQHRQDDLIELLKRPSKYSDPALAYSDTTCLSAPESLSTARTSGTFTGTLEATAA